jgi:hypothetical protein
VVAAQRHMNTSTLIDQVKEKPLKLVLITAVLHFVHRSFLRLWSSIHSYMHSYPPHAQVNAVARLAFRVFICIVSCCTSVHSSRSLLDRSCSSLAQMQSEAMILCFLTATVLFFCYALKDTIFACITLESNSTHIHTCIPAVKVE